MPDEATSITEAWDDDGDETDAAGLRAEAGERALEPGGPFGRYTLRDELGRGGMGVVYRAWDPDLEREVALKVIRGSSSDPSRLRRFVGEALLTGALEHPAVIPVHERGTTSSGDAYYTMTRVQGQTLEELMEGRDPAQPASPESPWSRFKLLQVFVTVCRAVAYAHQRGVVHRDLKPANVMVDEFHAVYVLDWGLARRIGPAADAPSLAATETFSSEGETEPLASTIVGTPAFMAPEQLTTGPVTPLIDVFGLGGILYVLLCGREPRQGTKQEAIRAMIREVPPPAPSSIAADVPPVLDRLCLQALAPDSTQRLPSAAALAEGVQAFLEGRAVDPTGPDAEFLRTYRAADYQRPSVTVDAVVLARAPGEPLRVALQRRDRPPFADAWACPGTFVRLDEPLEEAAARVLRDELGLDAPPSGVQLRTYGGVDRDPRTRVLTIAYLFVLPAICPLQGSAELAWLEATLEGGALLIRDDAGETVEMAFDHAQLVGDALAATPLRLRPGAGPDR